MTRSLIRAAAAVTLMATAACTQTPAQVELKGSQYFGRSDSGNQYASSRSSGDYGISYGSSRTHIPFYNPQTGSSYSSSSAAIASQPSQQSAAVQSIGISDLPPPPKAAVKTSSVAPRGNLKAANINSWTNRPHFSDASGAVESKELTVAGGDQRITREDKKPQPSENESYGKPVKLITPQEQSGYIWPVGSKKILSSYGPKGSGKVNDGINIASAEGEPIWAVADGEVVYTGNELQGYGNMVLIKHEGGKTTTYAHMSRSTVEKYDRVKQGDIIGYVGASGNVKEPQLHFAVREGKEPVDPNKYLSRSVAGL